MLLLLFKFPVNALSQIPFPGLRCSGLEALTVYFSRDDQAFSLSGLQFPCLRDESSKTWLPLSLPSSQPLFLLSSLLSSVNFYWGPPLCPCLDSSVLPRILQSLKIFLPSVLSLQSHSQKMAWLMNLKFQCDYVFSWSAIDNSTWSGSRWPFHGFASGFFLAFSHLLVTTVFSE